MGTQSIRIQLLVLFFAVATVFSAVQQRTTVQRAVSYCAGYQIISSAGGLDETQRLSRIHDLGRITGISSAGVALHISSLRNSPKEYSHFLQLVTAEIEQISNANPTPSKQIAAAPSGVVNELK